MRLVRPLRAAAPAVSVLVLIGCGQAPSGDVGAGPPIVAATPTAEPTPTSSPPTESPFESPTEAPPKSPSPTQSATERRESTPSASPSKSRSPRPTEEPTPSEKPSRKSEEPDPSPSRESNGKRVVYLTFDDGPSEYSDQILDILDRYGAKATFFVIGQNAADDSNGVRAMVRAGMSVQNHTWNHADLRALSNSEIRSQISRTDRAIRAGGGGDSDCVRPPYGATNSRVRSVLRDLGKRQLLWTIDTVDWAQPGADRIYRRAVNDVEPGSIVLAHDGGGVRTQTVAALPRILRSLKNDGYRFGTLC